MGVLMQKVPSTREEHGNPGAIGSRHHLVIPNRTARLDNGRNAGGDRGFQTVGEREERVACQH